MEPHEFFLVPGGHHHHHPPTETDPTKYPRWAKILDDECLMLLAEIQQRLASANELADQIRTLQEQMMIERATYDLATARLFPKLRKLHPLVEKGLYPGWRKHNDEYFYVAYDPNKPLDGSGEQRTDHEGEQ